MSPAGSDDGFKIDLYIQENLSWKCGNSLPAGMTRRMKASAGRLSGHSCKSLLARRPYSGLLIPPGEVRGDCLGARVDKQWRSIMLCAPLPADYVGRPNFLSSAPGKHPSHHLSYYPFHTVLQLSSSNQAACHFPPAKPGRGSFSTPGAHNANEI